MVAVLHQQEHYPVAALCKLFGLSRSTYYYQASEADDSSLRAAMETIAAEFPTYGSRRITAQLRRAPYHLVANRKRVQRLMRQMGLQRRVKRQKRRTTDSQHPPIPATRI